MTQIESRVLACSNSKLSQESGHSVSQHSSLGSCGHGKALECQPPRANTRETQPRNYPRNGTNDKVRLVEFYFFLYRAKRFS